jgi:heme/copper-type cytochrome/quinol oxidase subunit 2
MRARLLGFVTLLLLVATLLPAKDVYLSIGGSVGNFRTDARILNPSTTKDIQVKAYLLPVGNVSNASVQPVTLTIAKRQMKVLDDVVATLFNGTGLGAVRLTSDDDFVATQRIYAQLANGTLGQFVPGLETSQASATGALLQLKSSAAFRTNVGAVNPNAVAATVRWYLYDKANALVASGAAITMPPYSVIAPTNMAGGFFFDAGSADLSDAWISYRADQPIFAYGSVIDSTTTDPTFIPAAADSGAPTVTNTPPSGKTYTIVASQYHYDITPTPAIDPGDVVNFVITARDVKHGFTLMSPDGSTIIPAFDITPGAAPVTKTFTATKQGTYLYFCTVNPICGTGHTTMNGSFDVGAPSDPTDPYPGRGY